MILVSFVGFQTRDVFEAVR